jgi:hypothetical protein
MAARRDRRRHARLRRRSWAMRDGKIALREAAFNTGRADQTNSVADPFALILSTSAKGQTGKNLRKTLTSELPLITDMVWSRGNALRLPSAAKSLSGFGKKSQMVRRDFSRAVPETFAMI